MDESQKYYGKWKKKKQDINTHKTHIVWLYVYEMSKKEKPIIAESKLEVAWS